uniref:Uncharacterized protein n=1 Tax=viral metagenome TaxID=1070528 RepID=A0A6C0LI35_9ZZZZ
MQVLFNLVFKENTFIVIMPILVSIYNYMSDHNISIDIENDSLMDYKSLQKMIFIHNALLDGWTITMKTDKYIFTKKHEGRKEVLSDDYLKTFIERNLGTLRVR